MTEREHHDIGDGNASDDTEALLGAYVPARRSSRVDGLGSATWSA